jgi:uncharacterized protein
MGRPKLQRRRSQIMGRVVPVQGPSFDCKTSRKPVEQASCGDAELSSKDRALQDLYSQVLGGLSGQARTDLIQAENVWVTQRNNAVTLA